MLRILKIRQGGGCEKIHYIDCCQVSLDRGTSIVTLQPLLREQNAGENDGN